MRNRWFRFYDEVLDDPKVQTLSAEDFKSWVNLLCLANRFNGRFPTVSETAFAMRMDEIALGSLLDRLRIAGLIDTVKGGPNGSAIAPHGWGKRQYKSDSSTERVKRFRNAKETPNVTPPEAEAEAEADKKERTAREARLSIDIEFIEGFWSRYENKAGKPVALRAFHKARKKHSFFEIMDGLDRYIRDKPPDRPWLNPATFLNQERYLDQPAPAPSPTGKTGSPDAFLHALARAAERRDRPRERPPDSDARVLYLERGQAVDLPVDSEPKDVVESGSG